MSNPIEEEKLTPGSGKSYDGDSTFMADENNKDEFTPEPDPEEHLIEDEDSEEEKAKAKKLEDKKNRSSLLEALTQLTRILPRTDEGESGEEGPKLFAQILTIAIGEKGKAEGGDAEKKLALLLWSTTKSEEADSPTDDQFVKQDSHEVDATTTDIFKAIKDFAEQPESGLDTELVFEEMAKLAKDQQLVVPQSKDEPFKLLDEMLDDSIRHASKSNLKKLCDEWAVLNGETESGNRLKAKIEAAQKLLEKLSQPESSGELEIEAKEEKSYAEMDDASRREFDQAYAKLAFTVALTVVEERKYPHDMKAGEVIDPKKEASLISGVLFLPGETYAAKENKLAALLKSCPIEGTSSEQANAMGVRKKLLEYAKASKLDEKKIIAAAAKPQEIVADEQVNPLEKIPNLNEFEKIIEADIIAANADKVEKIQIAWREVLETPGLSARAKEQAVDAIQVLQNIYNLKKMQEERDGGLSVINRPLEKPQINLEKKGEEEADASNGTEKEQFARVMRDLVMQMKEGDKLSHDEAATIEILLSIIARSHKGKDSAKDITFAEAKIAQLLAAFQNRAERKKLGKVLVSYSWDIAISADAILKEEENLLKARNDQPSDSFSDVERIVRESVENLTSHDITFIQGQFSELLSKAPAEKEELVKDAKRLLEKLGGIEGQKKERKQNLTKDDISEFAKAKRLVRIITARSDKSQHISGFDIYIDALTDKLESGPSPEEMERALHELNARVQLITDDISNTITDEEESTFVRGQIESIETIESGMDAYRKYLIREINKGKALVPEKVEKVSATNVDRVIEESEAINERSNLKDITPDGFNDYIDHLKAVLKNPWVLTREQLESAYGALIKQNAVVRRELDQTFKFKESITLFNKVRQVELQLYEHIVMNADSGTDVDRGLKQVSQTVGEEVLADAHSRGDYYFGKATNMGPTVVEAAVGNRYYEPGSRFQLGNAINEIRSMSTTPDPALPANLGSDYTEIATNIKTQQEFSNTAVLEDRMHKLNSLMSEGMRAGINLKDMTQAQALAQQLHAQRQEIAVMEQMYKGQMDERTYKAEDEALYEGYIHTALGERIKRIQIELEIKSGLRSRTYVDSSGNTHTHKVRTDEELIAYYTELRKWAKILLKNDVRNNAGKAGQEGALNLSNERFKRYSDIVKALPDSFDLANATDTAAMLSNVNYMFDITTSGGDFLRYFMRNTKNPKGIDPEKHDSIDFNPHELLGVDYRHAEGTSSFGLPKSLEDTMAIMARQYSTEKINYRTGGDHELFDGEGNFKFNNFYYLIREQILNNDILYNKDGQINPMQKITVKGDASSVSLAELLVLMPEYLSQRTFDIVVDNDGDVTSGWGRPTEHPEFTWAQAQQLGAEVEFRIMTHEARIQYVQASLAGDKGKYLQLMEYLHKSNHWVRANNIMWLLGLPSAVTNGSQEIIDVVGPKETQGTLGKAVSDMLVGYNYINEVSKYYKHANGEEKTFNENMFYRFWEPNGANKFLVTMTEETLNNYSDAKREYGRFIQERIQAAAVRARSLAGGDAVKLEKIDRQLQDQTQAIQAEMDKQNVGLDIRFTKDSHLMKFLQYTEKEVLGRKFRNKKEEEEYFKFTVRDDLLDNLKGGLFTKLADMQVHELDTLVDKNNKTKDRPDTYLFLRAKQNKMRFGDIRFDGQTIEELLNDFNPEQIKRFDYTNKADDPRNHFSAFANDPDRLRRELDTYMDAKINPENYKFFKHNEKMMLAFLKHVTRIDRAWLNHFRDIPENEVVKDMEKRAMEECVQLVHGVDDIEATYAWWQARDYIYIWGIGDWLDDSGIGFRTGGKLFHTGKWRAHRGGKDGAGNKDTFDEFGAVALPFLNTIQIHDIEGHQELGHQSIFSLLQGGHGYNITPRAAREFKPRSRYSIAHDSEELYVANMLSNAAELADLLSTTEVDFTNIVATDPLGNIVFDYGKARELFKKWRKAIRYSYQKNGIDYREKIWVDGQEKTLYEFCFGKKTRAINELIRQETGRSIDDMFRDTADAVMASIIAAEVYEHRKMHLSGHHWTIENVIELEKVIREFMDESDLEEDEHGDVELVRKGNAFTKKVFSGALKAYHTSYEKMYMAELNSSFWGGLFAGLWAGLNASLTKGKWIY